MNDLAVPHESMPVIRPTSVVDIDIDLSKKAVDKAIARRTAFEDYACSVLREGKDFGPAFYNGPNMIYKSGIDSLGAGLGLRPSYSVMPESVLDYAHNFFHIVVRCQIFHGDWLVGEGIGSCSSTEKKYAYRWVSEWQLKDDPELGPHDLNRLPKRTSKGKAGKPYVQYCIPNPEIGDLLNTFVKMASKRARSDAVMTFTGLRSKFVDEMDMAERRAYAGPDDDLDAPPEDTPPVFPEGKDDKPKKGTKAQQTMSVEDARLTTIDYLMSSYNIRDAANLDKAKLILRIFVQKKEDLPDVPSWESLTVDMLHNAYGYATTKIFRDECEENGIEITK